MVLRVAPDARACACAQGLFNFKPSVRPVPLECHIQGFPGKFYCPRMATMNKPAYAAIQVLSLGPHRATAILPGHPESSSAPCSLVRGSKPAAHAAFQSL